LLYTGLNYQGVQLGSNQDASGMDYLHLDVWTANSSALNVFLISDGPVETPYALSVPTSGWSSVDIPLTDFSPVDLANLIQFKFDGDGDIYLDNIYFYKEGGGGSDEPTEAAPTPPSRDAADVISLFSNEYSNEPVDSWSADWDDSDVADVQIVGDDVKKYTFTNFAGIDFSSNKLDASEMTHFHVDIWTPDEVLAKSLSIKNVDFGGGIEEASSHILTVVHTASGDIPALATGAWVSIDVPVTAFSGDLTRTDLAQIVLSSNLGTVYIDNIYFYKEEGGGSDEPTVAAPAPIHDAADVISVFSDAYTNIDGTDFNPNWGQATIVSEVPVVGNNTLLYTGLNYQGIQLGSNQDASGMDYLHLDVWTANSSALNVFLISDGAETPYALSVPTSGWSSVDIPLSAFSPVNLADLIQFKFDGNGDIYLDNIYFYGEGGSATEPTVAAPDPIHDAADVISVFSDAYTNIAGTDFNPNWGQATIVSEVPVVGNNTMLYTGLNYQGIQLGSNQDASGMDYLHLDVWTANSS
ncbi:MAG: hypothetical protein GY751_24510, partial [Bacteroidetes bacterium]|nr:hypothetical protein [Bacteroidota bacterium]